MPDAEQGIRQMVAEGDRVAIHAIYRGHLTGPFLRHAPSGIQRTTEGVMIGRIENGRIVEDREIAASSAWGPRQPADRGD